MGKKTANTNTIKTLKATMTASGVQKKDHPSIHFLKRSSQQRGSEATAQQASYRQQQYHQSSLLNVVPAAVGGGSHSSFNLKRFSQATAQSMNLIGQQNELFNPSSCQSVSRDKSNNGNRSAAQLLKGHNTITAPTISSNSKAKTLRRSLQRN